MSIEYKYNIIRDYQCGKNARQSRKFFDRQKIVYIKPSIRNWVKTIWAYIMFDSPNIHVPTKEDYTVYFVSSGCWGMYGQPNEIYICPIGIENAPGGMVGTIRHEIKHIMHPEADQMPHAEKEKYINGVGNSSLKHERK